MSLISPGIQTVQRVLDQISLASLTPDPNILRNSCHSMTASVIHKNINSGAVQPTDEVVLIGFDNRVFHSFLIRGDKVIYDNSNGIYNHESQTCTYFGEDVDVVARQSIADLHRSMRQKILAQGESITKVDHASKSTLHPRSP